MANVKVDVGSVTLGVISGLLLLFIRLWEALENLKGRVQLCPMSIPLAEQSIFSGVCVTFAGCHIPGMAPSDPPQGLAWRSRP